MWGFLLVFLWWQVHASVVDGSRHFSNASEMSSAEEQVFIELSKDPYRMSTDTIHRNLHRLFWESSSSDKDDKSEDSTVFKSTSPKISSRKPSLDKTDKSSDFFEVSTSSGATIGLRPYYYNRKRTRKEVTRKPKQGSLPAGSGTVDSESVKKLSRLPEHVFQNPSPRPHDPPPLQSQPDAPPFRRRPPAPPSTRGSRRKESPPTDAPQQVAPQPSLASSELTPPKPQIPTDGPTNLPTPRPSTDFPTNYPSVAPTLQPTGKEFNIELLNMGTETAYDSQFLRAARRWQQVISNDLPDFQKSRTPNFDLFAGQFAGRRINRDVDDLLIGYTVEDLGGGGVIGIAGPTRTRAQHGVSVSTIAGIMRFDAASFARYQSNDDIFAIILHEMGHVLGLGSFWNGRCGGDCPENDDYTYKCPRAADAYRALNLGSSGTATLRIADDGGPGSRCTHWDDSSFNSASWSEVMTPFFEAHKYQLLTRATIGAIEDLGGYVVNYAAADLVPMDGLLAAHQWNGDDSSPQNGFRTSSTIDLREKTLFPKVNDNGI